MAGGAYAAYATEISESGQGIVLAAAPAPVTQTSSGSTPYYDVAAPLGMKLAGFYVFASAVVTPNTSTTAVAGTDILDIVTSGYEVTNGVGGTARCKTITRAGVEEAERLYIGPPVATAPWIYPRATAATFTATTAATTTNIRFFVPAAGGEACKVKFYYPGAGKAYTTSSAITSIVTSFYLYAVPTISDVTTSFHEVATPTLGVGQQDMRPYLPEFMSPDFMEVIGNTWGSGSTGITRAQIMAQGGAGVSVDIEDVTAGNDMQLLFPRSVSAAQTNLLLSLHRSRADHIYLTTAASFSAALDILFTQLDYGETLYPEPEQAQTSGTQLRSAVATTGPGGSGVIPTKNAARASLGGRPVAPGAMGRRVA